MKTLLKYVLTTCLIIGLSYPLLGEVVQKSVNTDQSWKCLDVEDTGWTEANYNDSWWEYAANKSMPGIAESSSIWYPSLNPGTVYFRKTFEIDNPSIISANLYYGVAEESNGSIDLYANGQYIGKFYNTISNPGVSNITSLLQVGKNVIAARVEEQDQFYWSLSGVIRYRGSESIANEGQPVPTPYSGLSNGPAAPINNTASFGGGPAGPAQMNPYSPYNSALYGQNTGFDASVTIISAQYKGYDVTVDGVYVGSDGKGGDPLDGVYSLKVTGNQPHTIRVDHPLNWKYWSFWYFPGENYTYYF